MAARTGKRPARDLIQAAKFARDTEEGIWRVHCKVCVKCSRGTIPGRDYCDEGWEIAKRLVKARNRHTELTELAGRQGVQGSLW